MIMSREQRDEFHLVAQPLMDWLKKSLHPHCAVIVTSEKAELIEGISTVRNS